MLNARSLTPQSANLSTPQNAVSDEQVIAAPGYLPFKTEVTKPGQALPRGACDCHFHIFEAATQDGQDFPLAEPRSYTPSPATLDAYRAMAGALGIERAVLVHPSVYGRDHSSFVHWLSLCQGWMRGVAVVHPDTLLSEIERWHALGARGTRCNALFDGGVDADELPRIVERVRDLGWHLQVLMDVDRDPEQVLRMSTQFESRWSMLLALNLGFFAMAAVMDEIAIMVILGPMLISIANQFGVDPIHFGAMIVTNVAIGMATPPIGYCLFVGMAIGGVGLWPLSRAIAPFILMMLVVLMLVTYVPSVALLLVK